MFDLAVYFLRGIGLSLTTVRFNSLVGHNIQNHFQFENFSFFLAFKQWVRTHVSRRGLFAPSTCVILSGKTVSVQISFIYNPAFCEHRIEKCLSGVNVI